MFLMILRPDGWELDPVVGSTWGRNSIPGYDFIALSRNHFTIKSMEQSSATILHTGKAFGTVLEKHGQEKPIVPNTEFQFRVGDKYQFVREWNGVFFEAVEGGDLAEAAASPVSHDSNDSSSEDGEEVDINKFVTPDYFHLKDDIPDADNIESGASDSEGDADPCAEHCEPPSSFCNKHGAMDTEEKEVGGGEEVTISTFSRKVIRQAVNEVYKKEMFLSDGKLYIKKKKTSATPAGKKVHMVRKFRVVPLLKKMKREKLKKLAELRKTLDEKL